MTFILNRKAGVTNVPATYELTDQQELGIQINQFSNLSPIIVAAPYIVVDNSDLMVTNINASHLDDGSHTKAIPTTFEYTDSSENVYSGTVDFYFIKTWQ